MPKKLERKLRRQAARKGLTGKRGDSYVFGVLRRAGWKPRGDK